MHASGLLEGSLALTFVLCRKLEIEHVKAHRGIPGNEAAGQSAFASTTTSEPSPASAPPRSCEVNVHRHPTSATTYGISLLH